MARDVGKAQLEGDAPVQPRTGPLTCDLESDRLKFWLAGTMQMCLPHLSAAMAAILAKRISGGDAPAQPSAEDLKSVERLLHRIFSVEDIIYMKVSC